MIEKELIVRTEYYLHIFSYNYLFIYSFIGLNT